MRVQITNMKPIINYSWITKDIIYIHPKEEAYVIKYFIIEDWSYKNNKKYYIFLVSNHI